MTDSPPPDAVQDDSTLIHDWNAAGDGELVPARPPGRARRRDAARRPAVAVGAHAVDRRQGRDPAPHRRARHRVGGHRPARRRSARHRLGDAAGARDRRRRAADRPQLRGAHGDRRHPADRLHLAGRRAADRGRLLHRLVADPPVRRGLGLRAHAAPRRRGGGVRRVARAAGDVRHRGHDARQAGGPAPPLPGGGRRRRRAGVHRRHRGARDAGRDAQPGALHPRRGRRRR